MVRSAYNTEIILLKEQGPAKTMTNKFTLPSVLGVRAYLKHSATGHLSRSRSYGREEVKGPVKRYERIKILYQFEYQWHDT
jgi:hypothetical protein